MVFLRQAYMNRTATA